MKRVTRNIVATGAIIVATMFGAAATSAVADTSALGLGCFVDSPAYDTVTPDYCVASHPAPSYTVYFEVLGRSGGGYAYAWSTSGFSIASGCTSSSPHCSVRVGSRGDWSRTMSVNVTELATGSSKTVTAVAEGAAVCGSWKGWVYC